jgi:hypothetical protein
MPKKKKSKSSKKTAIFSDIQTQLKAINQKLDFVIVLIGYNDKEEPHPLVAEALKTIDDLEKQ